MGLSKGRKEYEDEQMTRKRKKVDWFFFLSDDLLFDILKRLRERDAFLRHKAKLSPELFTTRLVDIREEQQAIEVKEQNIDIPTSKGMIKSWCKEFLLISDPTRKRSLYAYNLITKEGSYLPRCNTSCGGHYTMKCGVALSFDGFKATYKVFHLFMGPPIECHILILRRDILSRVSSQWKKIKVPAYMGEGWSSQQLSSQSNTRILLGEAVSVQGRYFHWIVHIFKCLVSVDMVKEKITQTPLPDSVDTRSCYAGFEMGGFLTLFEGVNWDKGDVWILKDSQRMKWEKLHSIIVQNWCLRGPDSFLYPVCSTISKRYIIFMKIGGENGLCSYDLKTGVVKELNIDAESDDRCVVHSSAPSFI